MLRLTFDTKTESLREEFRAFLRAHRPPHIPVHAPLTDFVDRSREWQRKLAAERFIGVHFPEEFGGRGLTLVQEAVLQEELAAAHSPQLVGLFGLTMVGPVILKHGSVEQKTKYLARILSGDDLWCQGFSEPEAGSDLAALTTNAVASNEHWIVNGQKVWTSFAQFASYCFMLVRTDSAVAKHKGLSYLLAPMSAAGITIRPLAQITGESEFNELFLENVQVPLANIVGAPGSGWEIAISTLMYERVILTFARHLQSEVALKDFIEYVRKEPSSERVRSVGRLVAKMDAVRALALSHLTEYADGATPGPEGSMDKLLWSEAFQDLTREAMGALQERGVRLDDPFGLAFSHRYLYSRGRTIAAGTSEIQRSIIAERVLGLPRK